MENPLPWIKGCWTVEDVYKKKEGRRRRRRRRTKAVVRFHSFNNFQFRLLMISMEGGHCRFFDASTTFLSRVFEEGEMGSGLGHVIDDVIAIQQMPLSLDKFMLNRFRATLNQDKWKGQRQGSTSIYKAGDEERRHVTFSVHIIFFCCWIFYIFF